MRVGELRKHKIALRQQSSWLTLSIMIAFSFGVHSLESRGKATAFNIISERQLVEAMRHETSYNTLTTTNVARFQAHVILRLARQAQTRDPGGPPLLIGHREWYNAFLQAKGLREDEAPVFLRLALSYQQDQIVDYHYRHVIDKMKRGAAPEVALNIKVYWPETAELPAYYSFEDTLTTPKLQVTNHRVITYRLLDFGDRIVYDEITGLTGRPTTGLLGALFKIIGEGRVVRTSMAIAEDGLQVTRTHSKKGPLGVHATVTVWPDGGMVKGVPNNRGDLFKLEKKVKQGFKIKYVPFSALLKPEAQRNR